MFKVWMKYLRMNVLTWMEYRADFFIGITVMFLSNFISLLFFWVIFQKIPTLNGWTFDQLLFLLGFLTLSFGIWHAFLSGVSPWRMERWVRTGTFDRMLLQPINPLLYMVISHLDDDGFGDLIAGAVILSIASNNLGLVWNFQTISLFLSFVAGAVLIVFSFLLLMTAVSFVAVRSRVLNDIFWNLTRFIEYPIEIYNPAIMFFLTFIIPFGFINYYPSQLFIGKGTYMGFAYFTPLVGLLMLVIAYVFWKIGIKNYSSTGS